MMAILMVPTAAIYWTLQYYDWFLAAFAWNVLIVYLTLGFRHYSHYFSSIQLALNAGDDTLSPDDLADPQLAIEVRTALEDLSRILDLPDLYDLS